MQSKRKECLAWFNESCHWSPLLLRLRKPSSIPDDPGKSHLLMISYLPGNETSSIIWSQRVHKPLHWHLLTVKYAYPWGELWRWGPGHLEPGSLSGPRTWTLSSPWGTVSGWKKEGGEWEVSAEGLYFKWMLIDNPCEGNGTEIIPPVFVCFLDRPGLLITTQ